MKARSINHRFLTTLFETYAFREFTTVDAQEVYRLHHMQTYKWGYWKRDGLTLEERREMARKETDTVWADMSARNTLCAGVQHGELRRVRRGVYSFSFRK